jgi:uncharacterized membrane protein
MLVVSTVIEIVRRHFVSGMLVVVPIILTYLVLRFLFEGIDGILQPVLHRAFGYYFPGLGVVTTILLIILAGFFTRNFIGARLYRVGDRLLVRMPLIRPIYSSAKQLLEAMTLSSGGSFKEVALVEYPRKGVYQLGFVSRTFDVVQTTGRRRHVSVFVASTPTPVSGMVVVVPEEEVIRLDMSVEEGIKFLVSGGVAAPTSLIAKRRVSESTSEEVASETG